MYRSWVLLQVSWAFLPDRWIVEGMSFLAGISDHLDVRLPRRRPANPSVGRSRSEQAGSVQSEVDEVGVGGAAIAEHLAEVGE